MSSFTILGLIPFLFMIAIVYLLIRKSNTQKKQRKSKGRRNVLIYSLFLAMSVVFYYVAIPQLDMDAGDVKSFDEYEDALNEFHAEPAISFDEMDHFDLGGKWQYELHEQYDELIINSDQDLPIQVKKREDQDSFIEVSYYQPENFYMEGFEVSDDEFGQPRVDQRGKEIFLRYGQEQFHLTKTVMSKEEIMNHYTGSNRLDQQLTRSLSNVMYQGFQLSIPNDMEIDHRGMGRLVFIED